MLKIIGKLFICMLLGVLQLNANDSAEEFSELTKDKTQVTVTMNDLIIDHEIILVNINGSWHPICSLELQEGQWVAEVDFGRNSGYCPRGHDLCDHCGLCHKKGCWYYVPPCWK